MSIYLAYIIGFLHSTLIMIMLLKSQFILCTLIVTLFPLLLLLLSLSGKSHVSLEC